MDTVVDVVMEPLLEEDDQKMLAEETTEDDVEEDNWKMVVVETNEDDVVVAVEEGKRNACNQELPRSGGSSSKEEPVMPVNNGMQEKKFQGIKKGWKSWGHIKSTTKSRLERGVLKCTKQI